MSRPISIAPYDQAWPRRYAEARARIVAACGRRLKAIEHVGSTAVPGLAAKPVIDIMPGVADLATADDCVPLLVSAGYDYVPEYEELLPKRRYFRRGRHGEAEHIHLVVVGGEFWRRHLAFRDYLRDHPAVAAEYAALKREFAARFLDDREAYTEAKTGFIRAVEARALS